MPLILHLGVNDVPYAEPQKGKKASKVSKGTKNRAAARAGATKTQTTGDVAEILEAKYHVLETFFELHEEEIGQDFADAMAGVLEDLMVGGQPTNWPYGAAEQAVEERFKRFLDDKEMDGTGTAGVPTKAARRGVNHRLKHPYAKGNPSRPSFIDTGAYQSSFKAWVEEK